MLSLLRYDVEFSMLIKSIDGNRTHSTYRFEESSSKVRLGHFNPTR